MFSLASLKAQEITLKKGETIKKLKKGVHYKTPNDLLEKFEGVWEYQNKNEVFKIEIKRQKTYVNSLDIFIDNLNGKYCYSKNYSCEINSEIYNLTNENSDIDSLSEGLTNFMFYDIKYDKLGKVKFQILENGDAKWTLKNREMTLNIMNSKKEIGFSVPTNIILTKIK